MVQYGVMLESRPCVREKHAGGGHSADLTGMRFGELLVIRQAVPYVVSSSGKQRMRWLCDRRGVQLTVFANQLITGRCSGKRELHGFSKTHLAIYSTVRNHWRWITTINDPNHAKYAGMPFESSWNPDLHLGRLGAGVQWILENLGPKPGPNWSLDIIEHEKGFVPGNLRWAEHRTQRDNQRYRKLGHCSIEEIEVEARRRGFKLTPFSD